MAHICTCVSAIINVEELKRSLFIMKRIILLLNFKSFYHALNDTSLCHEFKMLILKMRTYYKCGGLFILTYTFLPIFTLLLLCGVCVSGKNRMMDEVMHLQKKTENLHHRKYQTTKQSAFAKSYRLLQILQITALAKCFCQFLKTKWGKTENYIKLLGSSIGLKA